MTVLRSGVTPRRRRSHNAGAVINLRHIEVFYAIMRTGSITEAPRVLNVTQLAVSAVLKQFETRLGMSLFDEERPTRGRHRGTGNPRCPAAIDTSTPRCYDVLQRASLFQSNSTPIPGTSGATAR